MSDNDEDLPNKGPQRLVCMAGRPVFEQGAPAHQAFYIEEGRVEVTVKEGDYNVKLGEIGPGEIFGEMGVLEKEVRMATITALEKTVLTVITRKELEDRLNNLNDEVVRSIIRVLTRRLREASRQQVRYSRELAVFQDRMAGLMAEASSGIRPEERRAFAGEVMPLLAKIEDILRKYKG